MGSSQSTEEIISNFSKLPDDVIIYMALDMVLPDVLLLCQTSKRFNNIVCNNNIYWLNRLEKEYNVKIMSIPTRYKSGKDYYKTFTSLFNEKGPEYTLSQAAIDNDFPLFKISLDRFRKENPGKYPNEPIIYNLRNSSMNLISYLYESYPDSPKILDYLLLIMAEEGRIDIVNYLLNNDVDINMNDGYIILHFISRGDLNKVKYLVSKGADVHSMDDYGLILAIKSDNPELVKYLVDKGLVLNSKYTSNLNRYITYNFKPEHIDIIKILINSGMPLYSLDLGPFLVGASKELNTDMVNFLINNGASLTDVQLEKLNNYFKRNLKLEYKEIIDLLKSKGIPLTVSL